MASEIYTRLQTLSFTRPSGTAEEQKAAAFLAEEIRKAGFEPQVEGFEYTHRVPVRAEVTAILADGSERSFPVTGLIDSAETPEAGETGEFFYLKSFDEVSLSRVRGKIVLLHDRLSQKEYRRLLEAGVKAYLTTSGTVRDTYENSDLETARFRLSTHGLQPLPAFTIRMIEAVELLRVKPVSLRVVLRLEEKTVASQNLVVTVPGTDKAAETLVVGAHYDSVPFSFGAWDNGAGAVEVVQLLSALKQHPPRRTVKAILFGSEETGLRGSKAWVKAHEGELPQIQGMVNVDVGGSILGKEIVFVTAEDEAETWAKQLLREVGYAAVTTQRVMSSDCAVFSDHGVPSISMGQGAPRGGGYMHTRYDNMDLISADVLEAEAAFLAKLVFRLADAEVFPIRRRIPEKLRKDLIDYFGKEQSAAASLPPDEDPSLPFHF
ncbi:MAG: M20/M25/M40 family metallo-hydrolase [Clostridia bacterium]|nr:M20/M25/M40 family metallo-hydrolase [Clostridia bacterium]